MLTSDYVQPETVVNQAFAIFDFEKMTIEQFLESELYISGTSGAVKYRLSDVPYMKKPIYAAFDRRYRAVIVVMSARSSKTKSMLEAVTSYRMVYQPTKMLFVFATGTKAESYSRSEYAEMVRHTPAIKKISGRDSHGIQNRQYLNGVLQEFRSGTNDSLSAQGYGVVVFPDYDRSPDEGTGAGGKEGSKFDRGLMRTLSEGSTGICIAESSPSRVPLRDQDDLEPHELPRAGGITGLYNMGDRQWYYWRCPNMAGEHWIKAGFDLLVYDFENGIEPHVKCPHCGREIHFHERESLVGDFMFPLEVDENGIRDPDFEPIPNDFASFHADGVVSAWNKWERLARDFEKAQKHYKSSGDESLLQSFTNTSLGKPYVPKLRETNLTIAQLMERSHEYTSLRKGEVPEDTRFLIATVDVQGGANSRFDFQVVAVNERLQWMPIDGGEILLSDYRLDNGEPQRIRPHVYRDDWRMIYDRIMKHEYIIAGTDGKKTIIPALTLCDSGGSDDDNGEGNTTFNAYHFWRWAQTNGIGHRLMLVKGNPRAFREGSHSGWTMISHPNAENDPKHPARGEIPLLNLNSNVLKNTVYTSLQTEHPHEDQYFRRPSDAWSQFDWYDSLLSEQINKWGKWEKIPTKSNENFDHAQYFFAALHYIGIFSEGWDWNKPESYALPIDRGNINVKELGKHQLKREVQPRRRPQQTGDDAEWH